MKLNSTFTLSLFFYSFLLLFINKTIAQQPPCVFPPPILSVDTSGATSTVICNGNPLTLSTTSLKDCPTCTYLWSNNTTGPYTFAFTPGNYSVTVTDNASGGCVGISASLTITSSTLATPTIIGDSFNVCNTTSPAILEVANPCNGCSYQWHKILGVNSGPIVGGTNVVLSTTEVNEYYVEVTNGQGCKANSDIKVVGAATASVPPINSTASVICDSNLATISTIDCNGCSYEWHFFDLLPDEKLLITGIYHGTRPYTGNIQPRGIELYVKGNIPDLSAYAVGVAADGGGTTMSPLGSGPDFTFPAVSANAGSYIYLAENATEFINFFGFSPDYVVPNGIPNINGNDAVELYYNGTIIDLFGDVGHGNAANFSMPWAYDQGWAYRISDSLPNATFNTAAWQYGKGNFTLMGTNGFWTIDSMPVGTSSGTAGISLGDSLFITGIYAGPLSGATSPRGIELYAARNISDLSRYGINIATDGSGGNTTSAFSFPNDSIGGGTYIYLTADSNQLNSFFTSLPNSRAVYLYTGLSSIDGNDAIELFVQDTILVDLLGDVGHGNATDFSMPWAYDIGWGYRKNGQGSNGGVFDVNNWNFNKQAYLAKNINFGADSMPVKRYTSSLAGSVLQVIPTDSFMIETNVTGLYSVQVQYPNSCIVESASFTLDTSIFAPRIISEMPDLVGSGATIFNRDTAYLCLGSYVDLYMEAPFLAPPSWSYQWFKNGVPITGETGYNYRTNSAGLFSVQVTDDNGCTSMSNVIRVFTSSVGANPSISATSLFLCSTTSTSTLSTATSGCIGCTYAWKTEDGLVPNTGITNLSSYTASEARGYYVIVTDEYSKCAYSSPILEIKDTIYPAPLLTTTDNTVCSTTPINLYTTPCAGCNYIWQIDAGTSFITHDSTQQFIYQIDSVGLYRVEILYPNGCRTNFSNTIPATFQTVTANIAPSSQSICNGVPVTISALPDSITSCHGCEYQFLRNGVRMQVSDTTYKQEISLAGDYQVIVTNPEGCADTSDLAVTFTEINISTNIRQSTGKICGPTASVILEVDSCSGCAYQWSIGNNNLISSQDTFYVVTGYAARDTYKIEVSIPGSGCSVVDSVALDTVQERKITIEIDSSTFTPQSLASPTICDGSSVFLLDTCQTCIDSNYYQYQWYFNGNPITGASFESYQVDTPGTYYVNIIDADNCTATSNSISVQEFSALPGFSLDFYALGPAVPITYGTFNLDDHLLPASLHSRGSYSSLTAGAAISGDSINVGTAGSGFHFITYSYVDSNALGKCVFSTYDTLEVLGSVAMDILNTKENYLGIPPSEACLYDTLIITLTNFTFVPNEVIFVAGGGNTITVPVAPSLSVFAGVYSGAFQVIVPAGARTGKITLSDGVTSYESPNFYVIQNPAVTIDLISTIQPVCSNLDTAEFRGLPAGGSLSAHYIGMADDPNLMVDSLLLLDSVTGYSNGVQNIVMLYTYKPLYTGTTIACRDSVQDSLYVEIRDVELDSVHYTPISTSQNSELLSNLTLITYPISARSYANSYSGTYVLGNSLLASTIPPTITTDSITYYINNGGCINSSTDPIDIWPSPGLLDSIPTYLCSKDDTVFIQRNGNSLDVRYRGQTIFSNSLYTYTQNNTQAIGDPSGLNVNYSDKLNLMEIMTSNGGIDSINFFPPNDTYYVVPANVVGGSTTITVKFSYERTSNFFLGNTLTSTESTNYVIAEVSKTFLIENPSTVAINPVILADTIFCPINSNIQFLGLPAGGQYYISGATIGYDSLINNIFNATSYTSGNSYGLTYVYTGQACVDSAHTGIYLPDPFAIEVVPNNGTGQYCKTSPNDSIFFRATPISTAIDTASAQFFIGGVQSGTIFSPLQVGPAGDYNVRYVVSDIYGCLGEALDTFTVYPIPKLGISPINPVFCLNDDTTVIHLHQIDTGGTINVLTTWPGSGGIGYVQADTAEFTGNGILGGGISPGLTMPYFHPMTAGEGTHAIRFVYTDSNSCMDSLNFSLQVLPLPNVSLTTTAAVPLNEFYCENDLVPLFGSPIGTSITSGYGSWVLDTFSNGNLVTPSLDSATKTFKPFVAGDDPGIVREVLFYYYEDNNGCRDTATHLARIRNFTTDPIITGLPTAICAHDTTIRIWADPNGGFNLDSLGWFTSAYTTGFSQLGSAVNTDSTLFYPDSTNIEFANRDVILTFHYTDTSRNCSNSISDTVYVRALPHLTLSETSADSLHKMDFLGATLFSPTDSLNYYHICETAPQIDIRAYNTTGLYDPYNGTVSLWTPDHITSDTGTYEGRGIQSNNDPLQTAYGYIPALAGYGLDTIRYTYTDASGCTSTIEHHLFVDSLPNLSFAGLSNYDTTLNRYIYCQAAPDTPSILPAPTGVSWTMTFNGQNIASVPFNLILDTLAVPGTYMNYPLKYYYVGQEYSDGKICADSLLDTIQVRPSPQLAWQNVPNSFCMTDSFERIPLSATPYGGTFLDETNNYQVTAGIVGDSLFNPGAQAGKRDIVYSYTDTSSTCSDTIRHTIYVYNKPKINFSINGGCSGSQVEFVPTTAPYGLKYDQVAIDSITMVIWNFGDGTADTLNVLPDTLVIPRDTHTYASSGIFYPSLTVVNQGSCDTTFTRRIIVSPRVAVYDTSAYFETFDLADNGWMQESSDTTSVNGVVQDSLWQWGIAQGANINTVQQNNTVWGTRLANQPTTYKPGESAWVYSPCFDISTLDRPMIQLSLWRNAQKNVDGAVLQYHDNVTNRWEVLGKYNKGINWYQSGYVVSAPGEQINTPIGWTGNTYGWENARYRLDNVGNDLRGRTDVRFRIAFASSPSTLVGVNDGIAFDSVKIGNRTRNVLTEHFSGAGYPGGIDAIEDLLYKTIYNNLYGRDVSLIQYHYNQYSTDPIYLLNTDDNGTRRYFYGVEDANQSRINGKWLVSESNSKTSDLLGYPQLENWDIESLKDPKFKLEFIATGPVIQYNGPNGDLTATVRITALQDLPLEEYALHVALTQDSLMTNTNHATMGVIRYMYPNNAGTPYIKTWTAGESYDVNVIMTGVNSGAGYPTNTSKLQLVAFVQNMGDNPKEIYQVETTRDLSVFQGSVDTLDVSVDNIKDHPGYEVTTFKLYPNPAKQLFNVAFEAALEADYEWQLIDVVGRVLKEGKVEEGTSLMQVETDNLNSGMYIFIVKNRTVYTQRKVIIRQY